MWSMVFGIAAGLLARWVGGFWPESLPPMQWFAANVLDPIGQLFLRLLFFVVIPLVFASLCLGIVQLGRLDILGGMAWRTFGMFFLNMAVGVALGLLVMNTFQPGKSMDQATKAEMLEQFSGNAEEIKGRASTQPKIDLNFLVETFFPRNILRAVVDFQVLPLIAFALLIGIAGTQLDPGKRAMFQSFLEIVSELMTRLVHYALWLAPIAVPAMLFSIVVKFGLTYLKSLGLFVGAVVGAMLVHWLVSLPIFLKLLSRHSISLYFRAARTIFVTAFSTSSSNATLPTTIRICREKLGVSESTAGFVLPLGATMNMSGTALYEGCVVLFIAQVYGVDLSLSQQITLLLLAVLSSVAVAGIPGASLPLIVGLLVNFGIPPEGIALILGADRILDMARTTLNVSADVVTACIVEDQLDVKSSGASG